MDNYLSEIRLFPWNWAPKGWALCQGQLMSIAQNAALFSLLGTTYGGNGVSTFALPDLRSRAAIHLYGGTYPQGSFGGLEAVMLNSNELPLHTHTFMAVGSPGTAAAPDAHLLANNANSHNYYAAPTSPVHLNPASVSTVGQNGAHNNMQPYLVLNYCICIQGVFPSRN